MNQKRLQLSRQTPARLTVVPARESDIPALRRLADRIWRAHYPGIITVEQIDYMLERMYSPEVIRSELARGLVWDLAQLDGQAVGFLSLEHDPARRKAKLHKIYLLPEWHGKGLGRQMLEHAKTRAALLGAKQIWLQVNKRNTKAIRAYERAGFGVAEAVVADIGHGFVMDDYVMTVELT